METMIQRLDNVRNGSKFFYEQESKKQVMQRFLDEFYCLIEARRWLDTEFIFKVAGFEEDIYKNLSYFQLYNLLVKYARNGKLLKKPYNVTNKEKLSLIK